MHTTTLRQQHQELGKLLVRIQNRITAGAPGAELRAALVEFSGKLSVHLAGEDRSVYPALIAGKDANVAAMAKRFADEMGGLGQAFKAFMARYATGALIDGQRDAFAKDYDGIVSAVLKRVQAEEDELYPAADKTAAQ